MPGWIGYSDCHTYSPHMNLETNVGESLIQVKLDEYVLWIGWPFTLSWPLCPAGLVTYRQPNGQ